MELLDQAIHRSEIQRGGGGDYVDEGALQAAMKGMNLLQLQADVHDHDLPDENAQLAMEYLSQQFHEEYPWDTVKPSPPKGPLTEETVAGDKQALLAYAQRVTEEATTSRDQVVDTIAEKEERKFTLAIANLLWISVHLLFTIAPF